jgi:hypothetical protein
MPVKYIDVVAISDLFVPATRAFGDIAIVGQGPAGTAASAPVEFTNPADAVTIYSLPGRTVTDGVLNSTTTVTSATAAFTASDVGRPVSGVGIPAGATIATVTNATTVQLSVAASATASGVTLTFGHTPASDLEAAIAIAFRQSPPPTSVWGVQVNATTPDWDAGLAAVALLNVQLVVLANRPLNAANVALLDKLATHVATVSSTGGDGKERIGVAMLDSSLTAAQQAALNTGTVSNERMFLLAHKSAEDAGAAAAGVIAGYEPQISMLLKPISLNQTTTFSDSEIDTFNNAFINWVASPVLFPGHGNYLGEGYTANPSQGNKKYIDIVRTIDDINFRVKAALISAIGNLRVSRAGLRGIVTIVQSVLSPLVALQVIEDFTVYIPLLVLLDKDPTTLSAAELAQIQQHQADRSVDMVITVIYAGAIHRLHINLVFK